jgi:DNA primase
VLDLFEQIERKPKAKIKIPFERLVPSSLHAKQLARLKQRTLKELAIAEQALELDPDEDKQSRVSQIKYALDLMDVLDDSEPVPATWHGLNKNGSQ